MTREERNIYNYWLTRRKVNNVIEKQCSQCQEWKEENLENFYYKNKNKKELGFVPACRNCTKTNANNYRSDHADDNIRRCHDYYHTNKEEDNEKHQKIARDRDKNREYQRKYHRDIWSKRPENIIKTRIYTKNHRQHDITEAEWRSCLNIFDYKCAYCGISEEEHKKLIGQRLHKEHSDDNGYNDLRNAIPSCRKCNSYKSQYDMEEWYTQQEFFSEDKLQFINWWVKEGYKDYIENKSSYRVLREKNENNNKFHWNLWSVDEKRNLIEIIATRGKRKELEKDIKEYLIFIADK